MIGGVGSWRSDHHVDQAARHHDHLLGGRARGEGDKGVARQGGGLDGLFGSARGHGDRATQLAIDLQHQFDFVLHQGRCIDLRPGRVQDVAKLVGIAQVRPQRVGQMGRGRVQAAQQDAKTFNQRDLRSGAIHRLEVFQRVDHLHGARHHGVVLHALVVVVHLLEHGVHLQPQRLGLLAEVYVFQAASPRHACVSSY